MNRYIVECGQGEIYLPLVASALLAAQRYTAWFPCIEVYVWDTRGVLLCSYLHGRVTPGETLNA